MAEYIRDSDGFAWEHVGGDRWALPDGTTLSQEEVNRQFGPLTTYGGEPLTPAPDDVRALVSNAFEDFAGRVTASDWTSQSYDEAAYYRTVAARAAETVAALRSGRITG